MFVTGTRWRWHGLAAAAVLAMAACRPSTVDPSSVAHLQKSLAALREPLAPVELSRFDEALFYLVGRGSLQTLALEEVDPREGPPLLELFRPLAGRTVEGVVAEARLRRIRQVRSAVTFLESWRDSMGEARQMLQLFRFKDARVYKRHKDYLEWPVIEMKVENGTGDTVSLIRFRASLLAPGREDPWLVEEFDHVVLRGMAPGEGDLWRIEPQQREWIRLIDPHPHLEFSLETMRLVAPGGRVLAASDWGAMEDHRLATYLQTLRTIRTLGTLALELPPPPTIPALGATPPQAATAGPRGAPAPPELTPVADAAAAADRRP